MCICWKLAEDFGNELEQTKSKSKPFPKAAQKTGLKSTQPPQQLQPDDAEQSQSSDENDDDKEHDEMKVGISNFFLVSYSR